MIEADQYHFPNPEDSDEQGLLAIGGDLAPARILQAYRQGIFPWFEPGCPILWWSPNPRLLLYPTQFNLSHSLKKSLNKPHQWTFDQAFPEVIRACSEASGRVGKTWISEEMIAAYCQLHEQGYAHSLEVWREGRLIGGLYGLSLGRGFFGESMFHYETDASKIALYYLCETLKNWEFDFIDCQMTTSHLLSLGATMVSRREFLHRLQLALQQPDKTGHWTP